MSPNAILAACIAGAAAMACPASPAWSQPAHAPQRVFACSLGRKSVSVTAAANRLTYRFGAPGHPELSIAASPGQGNVHKWSGRYAGMEHQLRFTRGEYNYTVYSVNGNSVAGASAASGLVVTRGTRTIADMSCARAVELYLPDAYGWPPEDTAEHSAM